MKFKISLILLLSLCSFLSCSSVMKEKGTYAVIETSKGKITVKLMTEEAPVTTENFIGLAEGSKEWTDPRTGEKKKKPFYDGLIFHRVISGFMIQGGCPLGNGRGGPGYAFEDECYKKGKELTGKLTDPKMVYPVWINLIIPHLRQHGGQSPNKELNAIVMEMQKNNSPKPLVGKTIEEIKEMIGTDKKVYEMSRDLIAKVEYGTLCMANSGPNSNGSQFFIVTQKPGCPHLNGKHTVFGRVVEGMSVAHKIESVEKLPGDKPKNDVVIKRINIVRVD